MTEDIDPSLIKKTQTSLSKYVKEPLLNEKFLKKPPFRYLQDIIKCVIKETGFLSDVFTPDDLLDYSKDKERKIAFLKKLIAAIQDTTGSTLSARPNKIIAGLEVTKTLELLQELGKGITLKENGVKKTKRDESKDKKKRDSSVVKDNSKKVKPKKEETETKDEKAKVKKKVKPDSRGSETRETKEVKERKRREKPEKDVPKEVKKSEEKKKERPSSRRLSAEQNPPETKESVSKQNSLDENKENSSRTGSAQKETPKSPKKELDVEVKKVEPEKTENAVKLNEETKNAEEPRTQNAETDVEQKEKTEAKPKEEAQEPKEEEKNNIKKSKESRPSSRKQSSKQRPPSSKSGDKPADKGDKNKDIEVPLLGVESTATTLPKVERPKTARKAPPSARPGAPKMKDRGEVKQDLNAIVPEPEAKPVPVIVEAEAIQDDDKENMVVVETQPFLVENDLPVGGLGDLEDDKIGENEGALVAQILETKKELEESNQNWALNQQQQQPSRNIEIEWEGGKKQKREATIKEVNKLKEGIQQLTRATNPLGKLFDFLQEDVDSMQRELKVWVETNANYSKQLKQEKKLTETSLETYRRQLAEVDSLIEQEQEAVRNLKANILINDKKIISIITRSN